MADELEEVATTAHEKSVEISVNNQPVRVPKEELTGFEIKEAAIAQGVRNIETNFVLQQELGHGETRIIGDGDVIKVKRGDRFTAIDPDDNS